MRRIASGSRVILLGLGISLILGASLHPRAEAAPIPQVSSMTTIADDKYHFGNGSHNQNAISFHSPTYINGTQAISNSNAGGRTITRNRFYEKKCHCKIIQNERFSPR